MPFASVRLRPGVAADVTPTLNEAGYSATQLGRFREGLFQKLGGWVKFYPFPLRGIARALHAWQDLNTVSRLAIGTTTGLNLILPPSSLSDITPQTLTSDFAPDFTTTNGSATIKIIDPNISNVTPLDSVFFNTPISVGGVILSGLYPIDVILSATEYEITAQIPATANATSQGTVPAFTTTLDSASVTVTLDDHGLVVGDGVVFPIPTTVGGLTIVGANAVSSITDADNFVITASSLATSSAGPTLMNGGNAEIVYFITIGPQATSGGWGTNGYGDGPYGQSVPVNQQVGLPITATDWTLDNWGRILLACPKGGGIYFWDPEGSNTNAALVPNAPTNNGGIFVAMSQQILVAWGSTPISDGIGTTQNPLLVRWSDQGDFTNWTVSALTQAGDYPIPTGSKIMGGMATPNNELIWTDLDLYSMTYIGATLVWGFQKIGADCGLVGTHAATQLGGGVFWMGQSNFFTIGANGVAPVPCSVWDVVFQNIDTTNAFKSFAAPNSAFNEVWWFYPSASGGTGECDSYVKFNIIEQTWDYGSLPRSSWFRQSVLGTPIATTADGTVFQHEMTEDADGSPLIYSFQTGYFEIGEGEDLAFVDQFIPDMRWGTFAGSQTASINFTLLAVNYPGGPIRTYGPYTVNQQTPSFNPRLRGRQMSIQMQGSDLGSFTRLGRCRYRFAPDGRQGAK